MSSGPSLYNPRDTSPEQLDALLTGRTPLLEEILANLREQAQGTTRQHWLLRGQRGMGKTHLAGVIHYRVKTDATLNQAYIPLWLGEADTYEVYSAATLLKTIGERLSEETQDTDLLARLDKLEGVGDEEGYFQELTELLSAEAERRGRVLLVLMENLDALLGSFGPKERKEQTRQLRSLLLHNRHFLFISTTPTYYLDNPLDDPKEPLYAHLKERDLEKLTEPETEQLLRKLAQLHPKEGAENFLDGRDGRLRLRVIHRLTGGLPRSLVMAFTAIREAAGLGSLVEELRTLLDAQTAYFEARLSQLPARERAIVTTMALAPTNLTMKEIAARSRLPERTLSTLIGRLEKEGHVRPVSRAGGKGTIYELSEGLFRLWYQYRKGRPLLEPLVEFLAYWYRAEELEHVVTTLQQGAEGTASPRTAEFALLQAQEALRRASSQEGKQERERFWAECQRTLLAERPREDIDEWAQGIVTQLFEAMTTAQHHPDQSISSQKRAEQILQQVSLSSDEERSLRIARLFQVLGRVISPSNHDTISALLALMVAHFRHETDPRTQAAIIHTRVGIALFFTDKAPQFALAEASALLESPASQQADIRALALLARGTALYLQDRDNEALMSLEEFVTLLPNVEVSHALQALGMQCLAEIYAQESHTQALVALSKQIIACFAHDKDEPFRYVAAKAKSRVAMATPAPHRVEELQKWLTEYGNQPGPDYHQLKITVEVVLAIEKAAQGDLSGSSVIDAWMTRLARAPAEAVHPFFEIVPVLTALWGAARMATWLAQLHQAQLPEETQVLLSWYKMAVDVLIADEDLGSSNSSVNSPYSRVPSELRESFADFVKQVRALQLHPRGQSTTSPT